MGLYRLLLAILVMLAHMGVNFNGHAQGVSAVVSFFIISGFVMTALIRKNYSSISSIPMFLLDRAMRIFPQYLFYLALTITAFIFIKIEIPFINDINAKNIIANALLVPTGLYSWENYGAVWIPQGWSLGLEAKFYLLIPFLLYFTLRKLTAILSMLVFVIAYLGIIHTETWGYMSISGTVFIFLCGSFLFDIKERNNKIALCVTYIFMTLLFLILQQQPDLQVHWNYEVLQGFLIGLPVVAILTKIRSNKFDSELGNISYGAYLNHSLIIFCFDAWELGHQSFSMQVSVVLCSLLLGWLSFHLVESPVVRLRRRLRKQAQEASHIEKPASVP
jgi:peptidoglycan/LPS O-acetylase OafA/YrhL